ncbi:MULTISPECIES: hypothetical protein [Thalassospira]|uniref:Uncharacterized protein n=2 Tax=Thalassospira TaxID=168934 RepID=A0A367VZA6_9PROT|nr:MULTISPECIES: hypothetical protein [Thalassospira]MDG4721702.1 hypothetical protein [Thalassospira sp. FZY0004]RCK31691.1 hypothetical protein TH19_20655 [Thalassospira profundimaris]
MPEEHPSFEFDDSATFDENIAAFVEVIKELDAPLAETLALVLIGLGNGEEVEQATILNSLYKATGIEG